MTRYMNDSDTAILSPLTEQFIQEVKDDFWICCVSREMSLMGRREVLTGKAKFGIFGDGKEVPQVAMARAFQKGDWRSGYYRDQTLMLALGISSVEDFFAQLYADSDNDKFSKGRQMNAHFATPSIDENNNWLNTTETYNTSADISSTAGQMPRALGLALATKLYEQNEPIHATNFSNNGQEVCFCTIGDASTSEGPFWETMNAACVLQVPLAVSVWDDGYGISVPTTYQTTRGSISKALAGFESKVEGEGFDLYVVKGWNYDELRKTYRKGIAKMRQSHKPALFHITELTQPQGHSTSGSHERYKKPERLEWERKQDCIAQMENWMIAMDIADAAELKAIRKKAKKYVREGRQRAWEAYTNPVKQAQQQLQSLFQKIDQTYSENSDKKLKIKGLTRSLQQMKTPLFAELLQQARRMQLHLLGSNLAAKKQLSEWIHKAYEKGELQYHTDLYSTSERAAIKIPEIKPVWSKEAPIKSGYQILNRYFDLLFERDERVLAFGEDVGQIGDVNQGFAGLQEKYGEERIFDTGIREWTIMGQAIGLAMRGWRPIAEIQYLDYLIYGLEPLTDDLATLRYRSGGKQHAPAIIRTRGHRLEGIWHSGSPLGMIVNSLRGMCVLVPRNMVQAVGFYNTMLQSDDPAIIIESLNGYRLKEREPINIGQYTVPVGQVEVIAAGNDLTLVTYGSCVRIAEEAVTLLNEMDISVELIDVQSLLPFDLSHDILASVQRTNRVLFLDEDVPGGASAYMMQEVLEKQGAYRYLDAAPVTLTAKAHRPPYGSDGDYFTKPSVEDIVETIYSIMNEAKPDVFKY